MLKEFKNFVEKNNLIEKGDKILLALSGGIDSMVLAKLLILYSQRTSSTVNSQSQCHLSFAHCNFHLRGDDSNRDETHAIVTEEEAKAIIAKYPRIDLDFRPVSEFPRQ